MSLSSELNLQDYWRMFRRRKWLLFATWSLVVAATSLFTAWQTPVYQARAVIKIEPSPTIPGIGSANQWDQWTLVNTEVKSIRSSTVAERAARILGWITELTPKQDALRIVAALQGQIEADRLGESNLIQISVYSDDPKKAAALANAAMQAYIEKGIEDRTQKSREAKDFTFQELNKAERKLRDAEDNLRAYSEKSGARGIGNYFANQLLTLQAELDDLRKNYTEQHPSVQKVKSKIAAAQNQMKGLPQEETEFLRLSREIRINEELYTLLAKKYKEAQISESEREQLAFVDSPALIPESPIRPNKKANLIIGAFVGFLIGITLIVLLENLDTSVDTIEDVERFLKLSVLAVIPHIDVKDMQDKKPGLFRFSLPRAPTVEDMRHRLVIYHPTQSTFVEAYHTLMTNLRLPVSQGRRPGFVLAFSSAGISEGKTITSTNFALTAAHSGLKTLFIEVDLRRPSVHKLLGLPREPGVTDAVISGRPWQEMVRGTSDFLMGGVGMEQIIRTPGIENFRLLPSGPSPLNPADILGSARLERLLQEARQHFDVIVLDCPPVMLFADTLLLGPRADGLILVYKSGRTARGALKRAKDQLENVNTRILGVVLNDLRAVDMEPRYGYYYYSYKYDPDAQK